MVGRNHGNTDSLVGKRTPHVEADAIPYLFLRYTRPLQFICRAHNGSQQCACSTAQGHGISHMVTVIMGDEHNISPVYAVCSAAGGRGEKWVNDNPHP